METRYHPTDLQTMARATRYVDWLYSLLQPYIASTVIEVGAGTGNITWRYAPHLLGGCALEPDPANFAALVKLASSHQWDLSLLNTDLEGYLALNRPLGEEEELFGSAIYVNVLEHIENDRRELELVHDILVPHGRLILYVPAGPWLFCGIDRALGHYRRYTKSSLRSVILEAGFKVEVLRYVNLSGIPEWIRNGMTRRTAQVPKLIALYDRLLTPFINVVDTAAFHSIGLSLFAVAEKV